jgi:hypothetical protein
MTNQTHAEAMMDDEMRAVDILEELIDLLDNAGNILAYHPDIAMTKRDPAFKEYVLGVGYAVRRAKLQLKDPVQ